MITPSNTVYSYHYNATGSTIAMTNSSKTIVNKYAYDPFGNIVNQSESATITALQGQPFKFVGQFGVMTEPNGFYYMRARYYDPKAGRFISEDPIGFEGGDTNLMAYVGGNPVMLIDPSGLSETGAEAQDTVSFSSGFGLGNGWVQVAENKIPGAIDNETAIDMAINFTPIGAGTKVAKIGGSLVQKLIDSLLYKTVIIPRKTLGADAATSEIIKKINRLTGETKEVIHRVTKDGEIIHEDIKYRR